MKFTKMHGAGNDYVYVDCTKNDLNNPSEIAIKVSDRHFGIGSDGLILIKPSDKADFFMDMYNADGSRGKMCGNGIRCVGKFVYDNKLTDKTTVTIDTLSGVKTLKLNIGSDGKVESARVNMGAPVLQPSQVPVDITGLESYKNMSKEQMQEEKENVTEPVVSEHIKVNDKEYEVTCVSMGNPHAIVYLDNDIDIKKFEIEKIGPAFENHKAFPDRINTEFIQVLDKDNLNMRVWERGSGETLACGTGACASLVATVLNGKCNDTATLHLLGGDLKITWDKKDNTVYLEGPAKTVFTGEIELD
ncbi:MAG: diaminopimelate epimerase [Lachnospira sp.]|nr:diaminopimelate epimerase [Lachnospira sp.]